MKVTAAQLGSALQKQPRLPVFLVTGDEPLLCGESCDRIRRYLREQGFSERELLHVDAQFSWDQLLANANALSLFAEQRILEVRLGSHKPNRTDSQLLQSYLNNPPPDTVLLLICDRLDASSKKSAWYKQVEQQGMVVEIWPPESHELPGWLQSRARLLGLQLSDEGASLLSERIEGNLLAAQQELEKLILLYPQQQVGPEEIIASVSDSSRYDVFTFMDSLLAGDAARGQKILLSLRQEGVADLVVLWAITRDLRTLYACQQGLSQGQSYDTLCQRERIWGKRKGLMRKALNHLSLPLLANLLQQAVNADNAIKGLRNDDPWLIMAQISLSLSGTHLPLPSVE